LSDGDLDRLCSKCGESINSLSSQGHTCKKD
jgi:hypothetical protein